MLRFSRIDDISTSPDPLIGDESISSSEETELEPELTTGEESDFGAEEPGCSGAEPEFARGDPGLVGDLVEAMLATIPKLVGYAVPLRRGG
jgi:hypothetical protein